jgi:tetratricopeptide (TPR) repeat protein
VGDARAVSVALCLVLLGSCLAAAPTRAAQRAKVTVFLLPAKGYQAEVVARVSQALTKELGRNPSLAMKDSDQLLVEYAGEIPLARVDEARAALRDGIDLLKAGKAAEAATRLEEAVSGYEEVLAFVKKEKLARSMQALGVAQAAARQTRKAVATFVRLLTWRSTMPYDVDTFGPEHLPLFEQAKAAAKNLGRGSVELVTDPPGARAYLDGKYCGVTPQAVFGQRAGDHYATYKLEAHVKSAQKVTVSTIKQNMYSMQMKQSEKYLLLQQSIEKVRRTLGQPQASADMLSMRTYLYLDQVVFATMGHAGAGKISIQAYLYDLRSKLRLSWVTQAVDLSTLAEVAEVARHLCLNVRYDGALVAPPEPPPPPPPKRTRFYATWWFWTAVAAGGAAVALSIVLWPKGETCAPERCVSYPN